LALFISLNVINSKTEKDEDKTTLTSSSVLPADTKCISPPTEKLNVDYLSFKFDPTKEQNITLPSGTKIFIPKESLTACSIEEDVTIKIREFKEKASSFVAGIPMDYKLDKSFESAGMIEIRGVQNGKDVQISPSKPIEVKMGLDKNPDNFSFWKLNEEKKEWVDYPATFSMNNNANKNSTTDLHTLKADLDRNNMKLVDVNTELSKLIEPNKIDFSLPIIGSQKFDLEFDVNEFPELEKFKGMEFEVVSEKKYDKSFTKKTWSNVNLIKEKNEYFALFSSKTDKFKIGVRPVLIGKKKEIAEMEFDKSLSFYNNKMDELTKEKNNLESQIRTSRVVIDHMDSEAEMLYQKTKKANLIIEQSNVAVADFKMRSFGVFNCDHPVAYPNSFREELAFSFFSNSPIEIKTAYVFDKEKDLRYSFGNSFRHSLSEIGANDRNSNTLVVVDKLGQLGYCLNFTSKSMKNGFVKLTLIEPKDENLDFIKKIVNDTPVNS
jgi:hypothetical protein